MSLYEAYETDPKLEKEGVHIEVGTTKKGEVATIRVRRAGGANQMFSKVFEQKSKPYRRLLEIPGAIDPAIQEKLMREVYADSIVVGWENIEDRQGNPIPFSKENVIKLFAELPELFKRVVRESQDMAVYRTEVREAESGN